MVVQMHPENDLLVDYSSGSLSPAMCVSVAAHLHFCDACRKLQAHLDTIGGTLLEVVQPCDVSDSVLRDTLSGLDGEMPQFGLRKSTRKSTPAEDLKRLPAMVQNLLPHTGPKWARLSPSLNVAKIPVGEERFELALHKIRAGGTTPRHDHKGMEITVVVQGSFSDEDGDYYEGDFLVRQPGDVHRPLASPDELCICVSVVEAPIRLVGSLSRMLNPFFSFNPQ